MAEKIDLNAIRVSAPPEQEETREQKEERLTREIVELEQKIRGPSRYDLFLALSPEEKEAVLIENNKTVPASEQFVSVDEYAESLQPARGTPNVDKMRLGMKRAELEKLQKDD